MGIENVLPHVIGKLIRVRFTYVQLIHHTVYTPEDLCRVVVVDLVDISSIPSNQEMDKVTVIASDSAFVRLLFVIRHDVGRVANEIYVAKDARSAQVEQDVIVV